MKALYFLQGYMSKDAGLKDVVRRAGQAAKKPLTSRAADLPTAMGIGAVPAAAGLGTATEAINISSDNAMKDEELKRKQKILDSRKRTGPSGRLYGGHTMLRHMMLNGFPKYEPPK